MKKTGLFLLIIVVIIGCSQTRLAMMDAGIDPAKLSPGDELIVRVKIVDTKGVVTLVKATVLEYRELSLELNDSGMNGDELANDGVWSLATAVPYEADPGEYHLEFEAFDVSGTAVKVITKEGSEVPLSAEVSVEVLY